MTIWEISEKADYIADRHRQQQEQWHIYCNSLVQGITLSKARLHHAMSCAPDKELCFVLFGHFQVFVALAEGFNSHTIEYYVENKNCGADSFSLRITCSRGIACRPCWRCVSEQAASQVRQPIQTVESAITKRFTGSSSGESHF